MGIQLPGLVLRPEASELVCASKRQPRWSPGQDRCNRPPLTLTTILVELVFTVGGKPVTVATPVEGLNDQDVPLLSAIVVKLLWSGHAGTGTA